MAYKYVYVHVYAIVNETLNHSSWIRMHEPTPASVAMLGKAEISDQLSVIQRAAAATRKRLAANDPPRRAGCESTPM